VTDEEWLGKDPHLFLPLLGPCKSQRVLLADCSLHGETASSRVRAGWRGLRLEAVENHPGNFVRLARPSP